MVLSLETISVLQTSLKFSIMKIENFDYSDGHYDPAQVEFYRNTRKMSLDPLYKAREELVNYKKYVKGLDEWKKKEVKI